MFVGTVLLDLEEKDLPGIAYRVVEQMVINDQITVENKGIVCDLNWLLNYFCWKIGVRFHERLLSGAVMRALLLKHRHVNDHKQFQFGLRRNFSGYSSLLSLADDKPKWDHWGTVLLSRLVDEHYCWLWFICCCRPQKSVSFSIPYNDAHPTIDIMVKTAKEKDKTELDLSRNLVTPNDNIAVSTSGIGFYSVALAQSILVPMSESVSLVAQRKCPYQQPATVSFLVHCLSPSWSPFLRCPNLKFTFEWLRSPRSCNPKLPACPYWHQAVVISLLCYDCKMTPASLQQVETASLLTHFQKFRGPQCSCDWNKNYILRFSELAAHEDNYLSKNKYQNQPTGPSGICQMASPLLSYSHLFAVLLLIWK